MDPAPLGMMVLHLVHDGGAREGTPLDSAERDRAAEAVRFTRG